jgi:hypothetical protein
MRRGLRTAVVVLAAAIGGACGDSKSGPNTPLAIEFNGPELPSMLVGEQLHDTLGNIDSLRAIVFNSSGDTIANPGVIYQHADTSKIVNIDSLSGRVTALDTGFARVVAQTSGLQSPPETLFVVTRPDTFAPITNLIDTLLYQSVRADTLFPLSVAVKA